MTSEVESLRQRITELEAENAKLRQIIEENAKHKVRIEELEKNSVDISAENAELKAELAKLRHDFDSSNLTRPQQPQHVTNMQNSCSVGEEEISAVPQPYASHDIPDPVIDQPINRSPGDNANIKPSEEDMMVSFLEQSVRSCDSSAVEMGTTFSLLYNKLLDAEDFADRAVQEAIICYCQFGKALIQRRSEIASEKQVDPESNAVSRILNMEVRAQLPADTSDALLWKRIEQAKKLWKLCSAERHFVK